MQKQRIGGDHVPEYDTHVAVASRSLRRLLTSRSRLHMCGCISEVGSSSEEAVEVEATT